MIKRISIALLACALCIGTSIYVGRYYYARLEASKATIKIGILNSMTGPLAVNAIPITDATLMAISEINRAGGVLGRFVEPIVVDGKSDAETFAACAESLITKENVVAIFGCWSSFERKAVKDVVEKHNILLYFPLDNEGSDITNNIIYFGLLPNQQIVPAVTWAIETIGKRIFFVGSDAIFPRMAYEVAKQCITYNHGTLVGEAFLPLGSTDVQSAINAIRDKKPDVILHTLYGNTNKYFFNALHKAGITPEKAPVLSFTIGETELQTMELENFVGSYAIASYFQSINTPENKKFVERFKENYGIDRVVTDPMQSAYTSVYVWADAVKLSKSTETNIVRETIRTTIFKTPLGRVYFDYFCLNTWNYALIGKAEKNGQFSIVWSSEAPIDPIPYSSYFNPQQWNSIVNSLYEGWGKKWSAPLQ